MLASGINVLFDSPNQLFDRNICRFGAVEPIPGGGFAHSQGVHQHFHNVVFKKSKGIPGVFPAVTVDFLESFAECFCFSGLFHKLFQPRNLQIVSVKASVFIENLGKYPQDRRLTLIDGTLGIDIEKDRICWDTGAPLQLGKHHWIVELIHKVIYSLFPGNSGIGQQIRKHFQKV